MLAHLSVCKYQFGMHWKVFWEIDIGVFYGNLLRKSEFGYNRTEVLGTLHED